MVAFFIMTTFSCLSTKHTGVSDPVQKVTPVARNIGQIDAMIAFLIGKTLDQWEETLPTYFGVDERNNQKMIVIQYCALKKCRREENTLFLVYEKVNLKKCMDLGAQPLVNPRTNFFIGCEPTIQNPDFTPEE